MSDKTKMKPCPFCGGSDVTVHQTVYEWYIDCNQCGVQVGELSSEIAAAAAWNRRAALTPDVAEAVVELREHLFGAREAIRHKTLLAILDHLEPKEPRHAD